VEIRRTLPGVTPPPTARDNTAELVQEPADRARRKSYDDEVKWIDMLENAKITEESLYKDGGKFGLFAPTNLTLFTGNGRPFHKGEDEVAYNNLKSFGRAKENTETFQNYLTSMDILRQFPDHIRDQLDKSNEINTVVNNSMTDTTGNALVQALLALADKMNLDIVLD
jgi:hypothetical protein